MQPVVSIVGRPNVGKSTIFNRLVGAREAIVDDAYGVTRDRHYGEAYWNGRDFTIIDTGGYLPDEMDVMIRGIREQVHVALEESDVVLFVVDVHSGVNTLDRAVAQLLRQQEKPVILVANKADNEQRRLESSEFYELGLEELFPISATSGSGTGELLDRLVELLPDEKEGETPERPHLAVVGRPNVGKSSLVNALLNSERCIVTDIPGTTRDAVNSLLKYKDREYELVDTAGLRKKARVKENVEFYSTVRTDRAIRHSDVVILMIDAMQGFEEQDKRILREAARFNKGLVLVLNKWDTVPDKESNLVKKFEEYVRSRIPMMEYVPIITASAVKRQRIYQIIDLAQNVIEERAKKVKTSEFNDFLEEIIKERPLPVRRGKRLKILYGTQVKTNPPVFKFFMNEPEDLPPNYRRFLERKIRERYQFTGVPITMTFKRRN